MLTQAGEATAGTPDEPVDPYESGRAVYRSPRLWILSCTIVFWSLTYVTVSGYVPTYLTQNYHLEPARSAGITSYFWICLHLQRVFVGLAVGSFRVRKTVTAFGGVTTGTCFLSAPICRSVRRNRVGVDLVDDRLFAGFIYPPGARSIPKLPKSISPHGAGRAFASLERSVGRSRIVPESRLAARRWRWGWSTWMMIAGGCCAFRRGDIGRVRRGPCGCRRGATGCECQAPVALAD